MRRCLSDVLKAKNFDYKVEYQRLYSLFYKKFVKSFSEQYDLQQVVDAKTSDVSRACFLSHDKDAFYNENKGELSCDAKLLLKDGSKNE